MSDATEALANAVVGTIISWAATWAVLGYSPAESIAITAMVFGLSFTRAYILRRIFRKIA